MPADFTETSPPNSVLSVAISTLKGESVNIQSTAALSPGSVSERLKGSMYCLRKSSGEMGRKVAS